MANAVSHDQNFKNLILDYPREALAFFAPSEAPAPDDDVRIVPARQEQLKERLGDRWRELDVPLLVEWRDGRRDAVLFALEEESDRRRFSAHRLAHYCLDLAELFGTDRVVPVAIFLRAGPRSGPLVLGTERRRYLTFDHLALSLGELRAEDWQDSANLVARVNLPNMRIATDRVDIYAHAVRGLLELEPDGDRRAKYTEFIDIYAALTDNEFRRYQREHPEEGSTMAGVIHRAREEGVQQGMERGRIEGERAAAGVIQRAREEGVQQGMERGMERGMQRGMERGRVEGERAVLERLLRRRFGRLPPATARRLDQASPADLEAWAENVLDAGTLDEVFG